MPATGYEWAYGDGGGAGFIPTNDGLTCVFVGTTPARMRACAAAGAEQAFDTLLAARLRAPLADASERAAPVGRAARLGGVPGFVRRSWGPGWALVGDAGYFKDPITTHGITDALRDAELLADAILRGARRRVTEAWRWRATRRPATDSRRPVRRHRGGRGVRLGRSTGSARCCAGSAPR